MSIFLAFLESLLARIVLSVLADVEKKRKISEDAAKEIDGLNYEIMYADTKEKRTRALKRLYDFINNK